MAGKKGGENSKKVAGNAKKAEAAAAKAAVEDAKKASAEDAEWAKGSKSNAKKEAEAVKKAEQARKKAEKDAALAEEEASLPSKAPKNAKTAAKKTGRGTLDLGQLDAALPSLNATGIDNAIDALGVTGNSQDKVDRHPERRFKAAYAAYEERRLEEMESDGSGQGLRLNQKKANIRKEFEKSPENPFNQVTATYNATRDEVADLRAKEKAKVEGRLAR
ncbi:coiled-coil domain-containing protein [Apiospora aurea]|uniref:Coiled-coil domain-containing protein n=1 Tax=Apiospora aurea TaxID=335848 RepID=A0ABR1QKB4_9PEZI